MKQQDFDEYIRQVEPSAQESAQAWSTAIGLQAVDGLKPSTYLLETAKRNIEGDITIDEVRELLDTYYRNKTARTPKDDETEEADKVSANIKKILSTRTIAFNTNGFISAVSASYFVNTLYNFQMMSPIGEINSDGTSILRAISRASYGKNSSKGLG